MKSKYVYLIIFAAGAAFGSIITNYICTKQKEKEISSVKKAYGKVYGPPKEEKVSENEGVQSVTSNDHFATPKVEEYHDYRQYFKNPDVDMSKLPEVMTASEFEQKAKEQIMGPRYKEGVIDIQFDDYRDNNGFEKRVVWYFEVDDVLQDYDGNNMSVDAIFGDAWFREPGSLNGYDDEDVIYVRDLNHEVDYELTFSHSISCQEDEQ